MLILLLIIICINLFSGLIVHVSILHSAVVSLPTLPVSSVHGVQVSVLLQLNDLCSPPTVYFNKT